MCSKVTESFGMKPFCIQRSMKLLLLTNSNTEYRIQNTEVKISRQIGCRVIVLKLPGSFSSPFICMKTVVAAFHALGIRFVCQTFSMIDVKNVLKYGYLFRTMTDT